MKISAKSEYAALALLDIYEQVAAGREIARPAVTLDQIIKRHRFPRELLRKILQQLVNAKILMSNPGKNGGFLPHKTASQVSLFDILALFEHRPYLNNCTTKKVECKVQSSCRVGNIWQKAQLALDEVLKRTSFSSLLPAVKESKSGLRVLVNSSSAK